MTNIKTEDDLGGNDIAGAGKRRDLANGRHEPIDASSFSFSVQYELGRCAQRVMSQGHRNCPRVARHALKGQPRASLAGDGCDHADRQIIFLKDRALFDMHFEIAEQSGRVHACRVQLARITTKSAYGV